METQGVYTIKLPDESPPHSLGKPIEWKLGNLKSGAGAVAAPHSLGKPIEWKLLPFVDLTGSCNSPLAGETN